MGRRRFLSGPSHGGDSIGQNGLARGGAEDHGAEQAGFAQRFVGFPERVGDEVFKNLFKNGYFTGGAVIGSKAFVNEAFAAARERFTPRRRTARGACGEAAEPPPAYCGACGICGSGFPRESQVGLRVNSEQGPWISISSAVSELGRGNRIHMFPTLGRGLGPVFGVSGVSPPPHRDISVCWIASGPLAQLPPGSTSFPRPPDLADASVIGCG